MSKNYDLADATSVEDVIKKAKAKNGFKISEIVNDDNIVEIVKVDNKLRQYIVVPEHLRAPKKEFNREAFKSLGLYKGKSRSGRAFYTTQAVVDDTDLY